MKEYKPTQSTDWNTPRASNIKLKHKRYKTLKLTDKIRLVIDGTAQSLTIRQALEQFLDGGTVERFITTFDVNRQSNDITGLAGRFDNKMLQIDLY